VRDAPPARDLGAKDYHYAHALQPMNAASWLEALPPQERWRPLLLSEGPRIATWALALALGVQAAFLVTDLAGSSRKPAAPAAAPPARSQPLNVTTIIGAHLFGSAAPVPGDGDPQPSNIPLVLTGTIAGNDPQNGLAILGPTPQAVKVYAVGDMLPGNVKLHSVYTDRVVIDRDGQLESIALPHQANAGNAPPPSAASFQAENPALERMRRMISEQPNLIGDVIRANPVIDHGHMNGFRIYPGRDRAAFTRLGLHPADQVTAVNGTPLDDRDRSEQILRTLSSSSEARITVIRNGQQQELTLNIAQVAQEAEGVAAQSQASTAATAANAAAAAAAANAAPPDPAPPPPQVPEQMPGDSAGQ
jgi:general secretion pathway protein C